MKPSQLNYVKSCKKSLEAWENLASIYKPSGPLRKVSLYKKLLSLRMSDTTTMTEYLNSFIETSDKLAKVEIVLGDELLVIILLSSLPKKFENFVIAMETRDNLPTLNVLKLKLIEEDNRRTQQNENGEEAVVHQQAFVAWTYKGNNNNKGYNNHAANSRNRKVNDNNNNNGNGHKFKCYNCGKRGHFAKNCKSATKNEEEKKEQHRSFAMLAACNGNSFDRNSWCVDSGATAHMCFKRELFSTFVEMKEKIMLACDKFIEADGKEGVKIKTEMMKLFCATFSMVGMVGNFMSVVKATENGFIVKFKDDTANIEDEKGEVILTAKRKLNLFIFSEQPHLNFCLSNVDAVRWHNRYGHLNFRGFSDLVCKNAVNGLEMKTVPKDIACKT